MLNTDEKMSIGALSKQSGVSIETIRYYEQLGILSPRERMSSGYRVYSADSVQTLRFVKRSKALGFSLSQIKKLLILRACEDSQCAEVRDEAIRHLENIEERIKKLENIKAILSTLIAKCRPDDPRKNCPILENLDRKE